MCVYVCVCVVRGVSVCEGVCMVWREGNECMCVCVCVW